MNSCKTFNKILDSFVLCWKETLNCHSVQIVLCDYQVQEFMLNEQKGKVQPIRIENKKCYQYIDHHEVLRSKGEFKPPSLAFDSLQKDIKTGKSLVCHIEYPADDISEHVHMAGKIAIVQADFDSDQSGNF